MPPTGYAVDFQDLGGLALRDAIPALAARLGVGIEGVVGALAQVLGGTFDEVWMGLASVPDQTLGTTLAYAADVTGRSVADLTGAWQTQLGIAATPAPAQQPGAIAFESTDIKDEAGTLTGETRLEGTVPGVSSEWYINALADALPDDLGRSVRIESDGRGLVRLTVPTALKARLVQELGRQNWLGIQQAMPRDYAGKLDPFRWDAPLSPTENAALITAVTNKTLPAYLAPYAAQLVNWATLPPEDQWRLAAIMARDLLVNPSAYGATPGTIRGAVNLLTRYRGELARRGQPTTGWEVTFDPGAGGGAPAGGGGPTGGGTPPGDGLPAIDTGVITAGLTQALGRAPTPAEVQSAIAVLTGFRTHMGRDPNPAEQASLLGHWQAFLGSRGHAPSPDELAAWVAQASPWGLTKAGAVPPSLGQPAAKPIMPAPALPAPVAASGLVAGVPPIPGPGSAPAPAAAPAPMAEPVAPLPTLGTTGATGIAGAPTPTPGLAGGLPPSDPTAARRPRGM